jgi:peptide chain release factor 2
LILSLEKDSQKEDFWSDTEYAAEKSQELAGLKQEIQKFEALQKEFADLKEMSQLVSEDKGLQEEFNRKFSELERDLKKDEVKTFLNGKYDKNNAILQIFAGAGGLDAQDWSAMLLRMYERYCGYKGFEVKVINQSFGEGIGPEGRIGIKSGTIEIKGNYAYGILKKETGVHRLVRLSPFNANDLRQTSFALVELMPELSKKDESEMLIKPDDLKMDVYRSSGPGGQNVNKRETAVRITHLPTGIVTSSQSERLQGLNRDKAMKILYAKLNLLAEQQAEKEIKDIKGENVSVSWGNQIRSYILHPYKMVKDARTGLERSNPDDILDGKLEDFIEEEIKNQNIK